MQYSDTTSNFQIVVLITTLQYDSLIIIIIIRHPLVEEVASRTILLFFFLLIFSLLFLELLVMILLLRRDYCGDSACNEEGITSFSYYLFVAARGRTLSVVCRARTASQFGPNDREGSLLLDDCFLHHISDHCK